MLPEELHGPATSIYSEEGRRFLNHARRAFPGLNLDFIKQVCCEHPTRMDEYFPGFDIGRHSIIESRLSAKWIAENVRYDNDEKLYGGGFFGWHVDQYPVHQIPEELYVLRFMKENWTWPFPPVIVERQFALEDLGSKCLLGGPYHLFEGTHRVSYLLRMLEVGLVSPGSMHLFLQIT